MLKSAEFQFVVLPFGPGEGIISFNTDYSKCPLFKMEHDLLSNSVDMALLNLSF